MSKAFVELLCWVAMIAGLIALTVLAVEAWDAECDYREAQAKRIVSYGVVR